MSHRFARETVQNSIGRNRWEEREKHRQQDSKYSEEYNGDNAHVQQVLNPVPTSLGLTAQTAVDVEETRAT